LLASSAVTWYLARASGVVAYILLTVVVVVGVTLAGKIRLRWPRFAVVDVHRFGSLLVGVFIALHATMLALDTYLPFSPIQLVVPFASSYRPLPTALGIVAMELLVAVAITNLIRKRLPYRLWRRAHYATLVVWLAATVHGLTVGSDRGSLWLNALYFVSISAVVTAVVARVSPKLRAYGVGRLALPSVAVALLVTVTLGSAPRRPAPHPPSNFTGQLAARVSSQAGQAALAMTSVTGNASHANRRIVFRIDLLGTSQQVAASELQLRYAGKRPAVCAGTVAQLDTAGFAGTCRFSDGTSQAVQASWHLTGNNLTGQLRLATTL
jgi:methionine sulfoxide reductase heme-binding subunit